MRTTKKATTKAIPKTKAKNTAKAKTTVKAKAATKTKAKPKEISKISEAEKMCANVSPDIRSQAVTLANAVLTMQEKIEQQIPNYKNMPLAQTVTVGTGEKMLRQNPAIQEFRATVRDYAAALNNLNEILDEKKEAPSISSVNELRNRFKVG